MRATETATAAPGRVTLSRIRRLRPSRRLPAAPLPGSYLVLLALVAVLNLIGLVMVLSASSVDSLRTYGSPWYFFERQLLWVLVGSAAALFVAARIDYRHWRRWSLLGMIGVVGLLVLVLLPRVGIAVAGSRRWLGVGGWRLQPSEFAKLALIIYLADLLARRASRMRNAAYSTLPVMLALLLLGALVMKEPDMGTTMVLVAITFAILWVAGAPLGTVTCLLAGAGVLGLALAEAAPYRWHRLTAFLHPFADAGNTGYQSAQALVALGGGKLSGVGLGAGRASWGFLPNQHTDFIFAVIGEELGLVGTLVVVALFGVFTVLGVRAALRAPDRFGALVAAGVTAWVVGEAVINIGAVVGLLPVTGVPLPFISFGGSSLVIAMFATGILLNVAKQGS